MQFISEHSAANSLGGCVLLGQRNRGFWQQLHKLLLPLNRGCLIAVHVCPQVRKLGLQMCVVGPRVPFFSRQLRRRVPPRLRVCLISFHFWTLFRKLVRHVCAPCPSRATVTRARVARRACVGGGGGGGPAVGKLYFQVPKVPPFRQQLRRLVLPLFRGLLISAHFCPQFRRCDLQMGVAGLLVLPFSRQLRRLVLPWFLRCLIAVHF